MKNKIFYIGLTLISISYIGCVISFYLLLFGLAIFIIGAILVIISKRTIRTKLITILTPVILYVPTTLLFLFIYNYSSPKTILIPSNYDGTLRIIYAEKCGSNYGETDGTKILKFPENGILILNEDFDKHINYNYYLVDKFGNRTEIPEILNIEEKIHKSPSVLVRGSGKIGQPIKANSTNLDDREISYSEFYVYNIDTTDRHNFKYQQEFDSLTIEIVNKCRQK